MKSNYVDYPHPKASMPHFWDDDYEEFYYEEENGLAISHQKNSAGRIRISGTALDPMNVSEFSSFVNYPGGGTSYSGGMHFSSFQHIDWNINGEKIHNGSSRI